MTTTVVGLVVGIIAYVDTIIGSKDRQKLFTTWKPMLDLDLLNDPA
jgi:hypothetical protein